MSLKNSKKINGNTVELTFVIEKGPYDAAVEKAYKKQAAKITVPGFRKGKAPRALIEKMYGTGAFIDEALNDLIPEYFEKALDEAKVSPVSRPEFDVVEIGENGAELKATFNVKPEVTVKDYIGIPATRKEDKVTAAQVNERIENARNRNSRTVDVTDRAVKKDDIAVIDYCGSVDGVKFEGGEDKNYELKIGSNTFIPGFEDQIIGHKIGDEFDVNVKFPEDYHAENLKGKDAVFACKVNGIKEVELPALDDEFAKDVSEFDTFAEYKADIKKQLEKEASDRADADVAEQVLEKLIDNDHFEADVPEAMFADEVENQVRDMDYRLRSSGLDLKTYLKYMNTDLDGLRKEYRPRAEKQVKTRLALEKIAELEKIKVSAKDVENEIQRIADAYRMTAEDVKAQVSTEMLEADLKVGKASELVRDKANLDGAPAKKTGKKSAPKTEDAPKEEKPAAKKTTAKKTAAPKAEGEKKPAAKKTTAKKTAEKKD